VDLGLPRCHPNLNFARESLISKRPWHGLGSTWRPCLVRDSGRRPVPPSVGLVGPERAPRRFPTRPGFKGASPEPCPDYTRESRNHRDHPDCGNSSSPATSFLSSGAEPTGEALRTAQICEVRRHRHGGCRHQEGVQPLAVVPCRNRRFPSTHLLRLSAVGQGRRSDH
jgi:hypothetical protein